MIATILVAAAAASCDAMTAISNQLSLVSAMQQYPVPDRTVPVPACWSASRVLIQHVALTHYFA